MFARTTPPPAAAPGADVTARAVGALAVIHVVDLPATLGVETLIILLATGWAPGSCAPAAASA